MSQASTEPWVRARVLISGHVQGVGFRFSAQQVAQQQKLAGWVRNRLGGEVEVMAEGEGDAVQAFLVWCHHGPEGAVVTDVRVIWEPYQGEFQAFQIVRQVTRE
jgi:acylphosphatase